MQDRNGDDWVEYDSKADVYRLHYDWKSDDEVSTVVVKAVAEIMDVQQIDIAPLYKSINPDALNRIYEPTAKGELRKGGGSTTVTVNDCIVTVYWDGDIEIEPPDQK